MTFKEYKRYCKRCGDIFTTQSKYANFCEKCHKPGSAGSLLNNEVNVKGDKEKSD
jgi:rRNA maturation endonuclease Nob1